MEVAGLVLGGIPLAIHALQEYRSFLSSIKNAQRDLDSMIRRLQTQQHILQNTCHILLTGIAPPSEIEAMIQSPLDCSWNKYVEKIKLRLGQDLEIFQATTREMQNSVESLHGKLAMGDDGKVSTISHHSVCCKTTYNHYNFHYPVQGIILSSAPTDLKDNPQPSLTCRASFIPALIEGLSFKLHSRRFRFTLRKKDYESLIATLIGGNDVLHRLVSQSGKLEPFRQSQVRLGFIRTIQQLTRGVYTSLCASVNCQCIGVHGVALELHLRKTAQVFVDDNGDTSTSEFGIAFGSNRAKPMERWDQFQASSTSKSGCPPSVPLMPQDLQSTGSNVLVGLRLGNAVLASTGTSLTSTTSTMTTRGAGLTRPYGRQTATHIHVPRIGDLCGVFAGKKKGLAGGCLGFITDNTSEFLLSQKNCDLSATTLVTLREVLWADNPQFPRLDYNQKVRIAYALSSNLLPLLTTPWLEKVLNIDEIAFMKEEQSLGAYTYHLGRPFLAKSLAVSCGTSGASCGHQLPLSSAKPRISTILSLALVLVQIMLGGGMEEVKVAEQSCMSCLLDQRAAASQRAAAVSVKGGDMYADAVNWCLENFLSRAHQDDETFSQQYYDTVVAKLEGILDIIEPVSSS